MNLFLLGAGRSWLDQFGSTDGIHQTEETSKVGCLRANCATFYVYTGCASLLCLSKCDFAGHTCRLKKPGAWWAVLKEKYEQTAKHEWLGNRIIPVKAKTQTPECKPYKSKRLHH